MTDWIDIINIITVVSGLTIVLVGLLFSFFIQNLQKYDRIFFITLFFLLTAYCISDMTSQLSLIYLGPEYTILSKAAVFCESLFSSVCMPLLTLYILTCAGKEYKRNPYFISALSIWILYFILLCYTQFSESIYYFSPDNDYHRGPLYPLLLTPPVLLMINNLICLFKHKHSLSKRQFSAFLVYLLIPLICMGVQMVWYGVLMVIFGTSLASAYMFYFIIREQMDIYMRQREKIATQRASIMMLEMRPHFIYNTLTSIYYLCEQDSKKAQQVTLDFSTYLRKNFNAISKNSTIPFTEELEHTKAYLAVEMARFEGRLFVEYGFTKPPLFRIPPLTLQPIVENSIKHHGLDPELEPLHIYINISESPTGNTIIVEDNGLGFDAADNFENHSALSNIQERLEFMCKGTLSISSRKEGSTKVIIFIPL